MGGNVAGQTRPKGTLMILKKLALTSVFLLCMTILSGTARADNLPVVNATFEATSGTKYISCGVGCAYNSGSLSGSSVSNGGSQMPVPLSSVPTVTIDVPEPSSVQLLSIGMLSLLLILVARRKKQLQLIA